MGHAFRGAVSAWLVLIALQTIGNGGSGRVASLFADVDALVKRALDPGVPAIPDRRLASTSAPLPSEAGAPRPAAPAPAGGVLSALPVPQPGTHPIG